MSRGNRGVVALLSVLVLAGCAPSVVPVALTPVPVPAASEVGQVVAVVDGDTIDVATDDETVRVRLIGIDTPEIGRGGEASECYAEEARTFLDGLLYGQEVHLVSDDTQVDVDKYGRLLRHVYAGDVDAAEAAITAGAGYEYTYDVPYERQGMYRDAERAAAETGAGMWGVCETVATEAP
jgi:micrococcal nuclease